MILIYVNKFYNHTLLRVYIATIIHCEKYALEADLRWYADGNTEYKTRNHHDSLWC